MTVSITTRSGKGAPLTNSELDANFNNLKAAVEGADAAIAAESLARAGDFSAHVAAADPHTQYTTDDEATAIASSLVDAHVAAADPHTQYTTDAEATALAVAAIAAAKDVLQYANLAAFPVSGADATVYIAADSGLMYRWDGAAYAPVGGGGGIPIQDTDLTVTVTSDAELAAAIAGYWGYQFAEGARYNIVTATGYEIGMQLYFEYVSAPNLFIYPETNNLVNCATFAPINDVVAWLNVFMSEIGGVFGTYVGYNGASSGLNITGSTIDLWDTRHGNENNLYLSGFTDPSCFTSWKYRIANNLKSEPNSFMLDKSADFVACNFLGNMRVSTKETVSFTECAGHIRAQVGDTADPQPLQVIASNSNQLSLSVVSTTNLTSYQFSGCGYLEIDQSQIGDGGVSLNASRGKITCVFINSISYVTGGSGGHLLNVTGSVELGVPVLPVDDALGVPSALADIAVGTGLSFIQARIPISGGPYPFTTGKWASSGVAVTPNAFGTPSVVVFDNTP